MFLIFVGILQCNAWCMLFREIWAGRYMYRRITASKLFPIFVGMLVFLEKISKCLVRFLERKGQKGKVWGHLSKCLVRFL